MNKQHIPLIVAAALPFIFIFIILAVVYIPQWQVRPQHNFLFSIEELPNDAYYYSYNNQTEDLPTSKYYTISPTGAVIVDSNATTSPYALYTKPKPNDPNNSVDIQKEFPKIFEYDVKTDETHELSLIEAQRIKISNNPVSPDNYKIVTGYEGGDRGIFELFGGGNRYQKNFYFVPIKNKKIQKKIPGLDFGSLRVSNAYYYGINFYQQYTFIGWENN
jgi:hypothetical protein